MRMFIIYTYVCRQLHLYEMKARLNITIEEPLLEEVKNYASKQNVSVSELVENYFKAIVKPKQKKSFNEIIEALPKPEISEKMNMMDLYNEFKINEKQNG